jgi:hypothetical protein
MAFNPAWRRVWQSARPVRRVAELGALGRFTMSQQSDMADDVYCRLSRGPVAAAHLISDLRSRWGVEFGIDSVHGFVREVASCLLHQDDVEVGDVIDGRFVPWSLPAWDADEKIAAELMAMDTFLDDESQYVFRKRPAAS